MLTTPLEIVQILQKLNIINSFLKEEICGKQWIMLWIVVVCICIRHYPSNVQLWFLILESCIQLQGWKHESFRSFCLGNVQFSTWKNVDFKRVFSYSLLNIFFPLLCFKNCKCNMKNFCQQWILIDFLYFQLTEVPPIETSKPRK